MRRSSKEMQWTRDRYNGVVNATTPIREHLVVQDPQSPDLNANMLLVRSFMVVQLNGLNLQTASLAANWFSLGMVRTDPAMPVGSLGPLQNEDADRSWVFRQVYRVPWLPTGQFGNGFIDMNGEPYHLDWQYRNGKGTNVRKDVALKLVAQGFVFAGDLRYDIQALHLWQTDG